MIIMIIHEILFFAMLGVRFASAISGGGTGDFTFQSISSVPNTPVNIDDDDESDDNDVDRDGSMKTTISVTVAVTS